MQVRNLPQILFEAQNESEGIIQVTGYAYIINSGSTTSSRGMQTRKISVSRSDVSEMSSFTFSHRASRNQQNHAPQNLQQHHGYTRS